MGNCQPKTEEIVRNKEIDQELQKEKVTSEQVQKLLLLGAGECGKSTILKQMRTLHDAFTENEMLFYKPIIFSHTLTSMAAVVDAMPIYGLEFENDGMEVEVETLKRPIMQEEEQHPFGPELCQAIKRLWNDPAIKKCYEHKDEIQVNDSAKYFFENIDRVSDEDYRPTMQDILNARLATLGVQEVRFAISSVQFRIFDVGGQKSQRKKWMHVFDNVQAVIFITAISEFNQVMREDSNTNRLLDSLTLFSEVSNNQYFSKTSMILFLNKKDLFQEKINQKLSIRLLFSDYQGADDYENSVAFVKEKFLDEVQDKTRNFYTHETCATDTDQVQLVLRNVTDILIKENMKQSGF